MREITLYVYDGTENCFDNALNHVKNHLKEKYNIEMPLENLTVKNDHPAGIDCMCVSFNLSGAYSFSSFLGNTKEYEESFKNRPVKTRENRINKRLKEQ